MSAPRYSRNLFWPRGQLERAHALWPTVFAPASESYYVNLEQLCHRDAQAGIGRIMLIPGMADGLAEYSRRIAGDLTDRETQQGYLEELVEAGKIVLWPPVRNAPCWCGSGVKYKRCCGRPGSPPGPG